MKIVTHCHIYRTILALVSAMAFSWGNLKEFVNKLLLPAKAMALLFTLTIIFLTQQSFAQQQSQTFTTGGNFTVPEGVHPGLNNSTSSIYSVSVPGEVSGQCSITTDKDDYSPGEWVIITGAGWQNDDSVQLTITHLDPLPVPNHYHNPWFVKPNADGTIHEKWFVEEQELGTALKLEARGTQSGNYSLTYFTDSKIGFVSAVVSGAPVTICSGNTINLSLIVSTCSGGGNGFYTANYQWQQSSDGSIWINATGTSTNTTYSASPSSSTFYHCIITITGTWQGCGVKPTDPPYITPSALITVAPPTLTLTSDPSTSNQTACIGSPIIPITYLVGGAGTGATGSGLPAEVTGSYNSTSHIYTISGTPTASGTFNYSVAATNGTCTSTSLSGTIIVASAIPPGVVTAVRSGGRCGVNIVGTAVTCPDGTSATYAWYTQPQGNPNDPRTLIPDSARKDLFPVIEDAGRFRFSRTATCGSCKSDYAGPNSPISSYMGISITTFSSSCAGSNNASATATVVGGTQPFIFTWYKNNVLYYASSIIYGDQTNTISNLGPGSYYVIVGDQADLSGGPKCTATSTAVVITQNDVTQGIISASQSICSGTNATALIGTASGSGILSYQWQSSIDNGGTWQNVSGATGVAFTPTGLTSTTQYHRIVTSTLNGTPCSNISNSVTITVYPIVTITAQPQSQTDCKGNSVVFGVIFTGGTAPITYAWQRKLPSGSFTNISGDPDITGESTATMQVSNIGSTNSPNQTQYQVVITDACAITTSLPATLTVNEITGLVPSPATPSVKSVVICEGEGMTYTVQTSGALPTSYQWLKDNIPLVNGPNYSGVTTSTLTILGAIPSQSGAYRVMVGFPITLPNNNGKDTCRRTSNLTRDLTVNPKPVITAMTAVICSRDGFIVTPVNGINGLVPTETTYSWSAPSGTGFTGGAPGSGAASISGTLTNTTTATVTATYIVTPTALDCPGNTFTVTVTINPLPTTSAIYHR